MWERRRAKFLSIISKHKWLRADCKLGDNRLTPKLIVCQPVLSVGILRKITLVFTQVVWTIKTTVLRDRHQHSQNSDTEGNSFLMVSLIERIRGHSLNVQIVNFCSIWNNWGLSVKSIRSRPNYLFFTSTTGYSCRIFGCFVHFLR